ncbi:N2,N2-dimethylguanosine tRNA methyltransferase [Rhizopogon vinicolor AM-OR11-026]|uniref:tRNA (guanine(26)-N(2))-dimethyltransferase n=1 Tax=Rhizopogon vinicolor AM-OR11-026 TaxID=1314800 RepID=A0A1B7NIT2_9AGAM|nr:N2,N2-dimethylguanosine tRNA methyltransferase [Rhizopogon vinicolor AM-OR11-026]
MSDAGSPSITVPEGFTLHTENTSHILISSKGEAFLNPVQEFNRDLSVACIRVWSEELNREKETKWKQTQERRAKREADADAKAGQQKDQKKPKMESGEQSNDPEDNSPGDDPATGNTLSEVNKREYRPHKFVLLEALSATGLRSIRYAKEIPLVRFVIANDLSASATAAMKRNVELNGLGPSPDPTESALSSSMISEHQPHDRGKVRINEGDACALMYNHRTEKTRVDVVDLDPYGTAAPFIDGAVQCINDGGLLCVTCTDLSVLATTNYPEKCFSNYGGIPVKAEYCHESALRLVLHTLSTSASRYGRYIEPQLSLSIDFYVRLFVRIHSAPIEVKKAASKTAMYYICQGCQSFYEQPLGRMIDKVHERSGNVNLLFKTQAGPSVGQKCTECGSAQHIAGPMWSGPLHNNNFLSKVLEHLESNQGKYGTAVRMRGMLTVAKEELHVPFYFTPSRIAGFFHSICPPLDDVASALLNAGYRVSRSHALAGSLKTNATRQDVHDVFRSWVKKHPVRMDKISETSLARQLLAKEARTEAIFSRHPQSVTQASKIKLVRYQQNPAPNWGPGTKADSGTKRKREEEDE